MLFMLPFEPAKMSVLPSANATIRGTVYSPLIDSAELSQLNLYHVIKPHLHIQQWLEDPGTQTSLCYSFSFLIILFHSLLIRI